MARGRGGFTAVGASALVVAAALLVGVPTTTAIADDSTPTWAQVQAAKNDAAAAQQALTQIQAAVVQLTRVEDAAASAELRSAYLATEAQTRLQAAQAKLSVVQGRLVTARHDAEQARHRFAATALEMDRLGGDDLTVRVLAGGDGSANLLDQLTALDQLTRSSADLESAALQKQHEVEALQGAAASAERARASAQADAVAALATAQAARATAQSELIAGQQQQADLARKAQTLGGQAQSLQVAYTAAQEALAAKAGDLSSIDTSGVVVDPAGAKAYARQALAGHGWGSDQFGCLVQLWTMESGWRANAYNTSSGAYGIPQALPASKMQSAGPDWLTNGDTQIDWGLSYIARAYGSPCGAWAFEMSHSPHWY